MTQLATVVTATRKLKALDFYRAFSPLQASWRSSGIPDRTQVAYQTWLTRNRLPEKGPLRRGAPRPGDFRFSEFHARFVAIGELVEGKLLQLCRTACQDPAHCRDGDDQVPEPEPSASLPVACATLSMPRNVRFTIPRRLI